MFVLKICSVDGVTVLLILLLLLFRYFASEEFKTGVPTPGWLRNYITFLYLYMYILGFLKKRMKAEVVWSKRL